MFGASLKSLEIMPPARKVSSVPYVQIVRDLCISTLCCCMVGIYHPNSMRSTDTLCSLPSPSSAYQADIFLPLGLFPTIRITLMLRCEAPRLFRLAQEHLRDLDPITRERTAQQSLQLIPASICRWTLIKLGRECLEETDGDVTMLE